MKKESDKDMDMEHRHVYGKNGHRHGRGHQKYSKEYVLPKYQTFQQSISPFPG
jgi:hypothetical protein